MSRTSTELNYIMESVSDKRVHKQLKPKIGFVTSYDPNTYAVRVRLEPESTANEENGLANPVVETNWLPVFRPYGGNGWGLYTPPVIGDQVLVLWPDGGHGVAFSAFYNDSEKPYKTGDPSEATGSQGDANGNPAGREFILVHPTGSHIKVQNDGSVWFRSSDGTIIQMSNAGEVTVISSTGASIVIDNAGNVAVASAGGATIQLSGANIQLN